MTDHARLLAEIIADPDDDGARLAFTDLLEEQAEGSPAVRQAALDRAAFIRLQIRLATIQATDPEPLSLQRNGHRLVTSTPWGQMSFAYQSYFTAERLRLLRKEARLLCRYAPTWEEGLPSWSRQVYQMPWSRFRRGFVSTAGVDMKRLLESDNELWRRHPIDALELEGVRGRERRKLLKFRPLEQVRELGLHPIKTTFDRETAHALAESPHLRHLRTLHLGWSHFDDPAAAAFAVSSHLRPRFLSLSVQRMSVSAFSQMMNSPIASKLVRLIVHKTSVYEGAER